MRLKLLFSANIRINLFLFILSQCLGFSQEASDQEMENCGNEETNYKPCTNKAVADKLFHWCCSHFVPPECHNLCMYVTDRNDSSKMLHNLVANKRCDLKYISSVLYCASQNRDNRNCCRYLDLNNPRLQVGSRCLRFCDPFGSAIDRITREDATCLYNWNVIMYCHHSGISKI